MSQVFGIKRGPSIATLLAALAAGSQAAPMMIEAPKAVNNAPITRSARSWINRSRNRGTGARRKNVPAHIQDQLIKAASVKLVRKSVALIHNAAERDCGYYRCKPVSNKHRFFPYSFGEV